ncbi:ribonuclease VapC [Aureimonas sp. SA4125]|uniref:type II toxin-antitoxin system VapC family toxin n=1 Tax=Aureimonas sp. SA4125 TaxID=2826993 RepID=UPI001CC55CFE|nr:type II toxin-antitoxin system VapC family toxin [Aureimonas sp. SA4125]BDA87142.1 ribonuclease VapC [Aureimonas sp. SA4125]
MIVVDTSALVAVLNEEPSAERVVRRALDAERIFLSSGTAVELGIVVFSKWGPSGLQRLDLIVRRLQIDTVDLTAEEARIAVAAYSTYGRGTGSPARLNFGDCFAYALAKARGLPLLFVGDDFVHTDLVSALDRA